MLVDPDGALAHLAPGALVVDSSTIDIGVARGLHETVRATGARFFDAPVSGGISGAAAGTLTFMVGGSEEDLAAAQPYLDILGGRVVYAGPAGSGQAAKIINNMMAGVNLTGLCESAVLAQRLGLAPRLPLHRRHLVGRLVGAAHLVPGQGVVDSAPVNRDSEGGFAVALLHKDLGLAVAAGKSTGTPLEFAIHGPRGLRP